MTKEILLIKAVTEDQMGTKFFFQLRSVLWSSDLLNTIKMKVRSYYSVTSTSQHQIFDEKFDQEPESVRIKMADLAGR